MTSNIGTIDRTARFIVGMALIVAPLVNFLGLWTNSVVAYGAVAVGVVLVATALVRFCPLYRILGISSCKV